MYKVLNRILSSLNLKPKFNAAKVKEYIAKFSDEKIEVEIIPLLESLEPTEKAEIIEALDENGFIDKQISVLMANGKVEKKLKAIEVLVQIGHDKGFLAMITVLKDPREEIKWALTEALKACQRPHLIMPKLIEALKNPHQWLPARIAEICASYGEEAIPYLAKELKKGTPNDKGIIIEILGELKSEQAITELKRHSSSLEEDNELFAKTIYAMGRIRSEVGLDLIISSLKKHEPKIKLAAIQALENQNTREHGTHLLSLLACEHALVRMKSGQALKVLGWEIDSAHLKKISQKSFDLEELNQVIEQVRAKNLAS